MYQLDFSGNYVSIVSGFITSSLGEPSHPKTVKPFLSVTFTKPFHWTKLSSHRPCCETRDFALKIWTPGTVFLASDGSLKSAMAGQKSGSASSKYQVWLPNEEFRNSPLLTQLVILYKFHGQKLLKVMFLFISKWFSDFMWQYSTETNSSSLKRKRRRIGKRPLGN